MRGRKLRTNILKFSLSNRCASAAMVSKTSDDLPEPDIPVKIIILRLGIFKLTSLRLFSRAPRISIYSCIITPYTDTLFSGISCVAFLAPQQVAYITGVTIQVDSGLMRSLFQAEHVEDVGRSGPKQAKYLALN